MTLKQRLLVRLYPLIMQLTKKRAKHSHIPKEVEPIKPFHSLKVPLLKNNILDFATLKGKKILLVNTASDCGFTAQYAELQKLHEEYSSQLQIVAFPSNDFGKQEKGSDEEIVQFCSDNYGVSFPVTLKSTVKKDAQQNTVYQWLSNKDLNGWNDQAPTWNFCKYLINEKGILTHFFDASISPLSKTVIEAIKQ